ncbi:MAG: PAS domain-containing protein [Lachnospiraceae bacterium]|nr:PAS domain-containing protein [Lachnospiraceae bacterium]
MLNNEFIKQYTPLVNFLGATLGPDYEVVLYQLIKRPFSISAISNGHISNREVGAPITNLAIQMIEDKYYIDHDYKLNYRGKTASGKVLRCSTFFIKDPHGELLGLMCINFDDTRYKELSEKLFWLCHPDDYIEKTISINVLPNNADSSDGYGQESFYNSISSATDGAILAVMGSNNVPVDRLTKDEKIKIIKKLNEDGIFALKGTIPVVANKLECSQATIYRYVSKVKKTQI